MAPITETIAPKILSSWIVNYIDRDSGESITHLKLQKLLYYVEAWYLANFDRQLFPESPQAWTHGPVYKSVYDKYSGKGWDALPKENSVSLPNQELAEYVLACLDEYGQYSAKKLEKMTHEEDPWKVARGDLPLEARCQNKIDKLLTRNYYASRIGKEKIKKILD